MTSRVLALGDVGKEERGVGGSRGEPVIHGCAKACFAESRSSWFCLHSFRQRSLAALWR